MISNQYQYQNQTSFQGNLLLEGVKLPKGKFKQVAKIYASKTKGKPDLILSGRRENGYKGQFYHATDALLNGDNIASILTFALKSMFKNRSPKKFAEELVNLSRRFNPKDEANMLRSEINGLKRRLLYTKFNLEKSRNPKHTKELQTLIGRMEATISKKEAQYAKIKPGDISGIWC